MGSNYRIIPVGGGGGTAPTGTLDVSQNGTYNVVGYKYVDVSISDEPDYLCFTAVDTGATIRVPNMTASMNIEYSFDRETWTRLTSIAVTLPNAGDKVYLRGSNALGLGTSGDSLFTMENGRIAASGNVDTLLKYVNELTTVPGNGYKYMFKNCTNLVSAPYSNARYVNGESQYAFMFQGCTGLTSIPKFPFIEARETNYARTFEGMYKDCTGLTGTLDLSYIYSPLDFCCETYSIFEGTNYTKVDLSNLLYAPSYACKRAFMNMTELESVDLSGLEELTGNYSCEQMFKNCTNLKEVKTNLYLGITTNRLQYWLENVSVNGDFFNLHDANFSIGPSGIPQGWAIHTSL